MAGIFWDYVQGGNQYEYGIVEDHSWVAGWNVQVRLNGIVGAE